MTAAPPTIPYATPHQRPGVVVWMNVYAVFMALLYVLCSVGGVLLWLNLEAMQGDEDFAPTAIVLMVVGPPLAIAFGIAPFLPRRKWAWIYDIVLIAIGLSGCTLVAAVPLLIFWLQQRTKDWFNA